MLRNAILRRSYASFISSPFRSIEMPQVTLPQFIWDSIDAWPDKTAIECGLTGRSLRYSQIKTLSQRLGRSLLDMGLQRGDSVTLVLPNCPEFPVALLGPLHAGLKVSTINPVYTPDEISHQMRDSGAKCVITDPHTLSTVLSARRQVNRDIAVISVSGTEGVSRQLPGSVRHMEELVREGLPTDCGLPTDAGQSTADTCLLPYSSGTTGLPKGVRLSHSNLTANLVQINHPDMSRICLPTKETQDVVPAVLPFFHLYGMVVVMLQSLTRGAKLVTLPRFEHENFLKILENNKEIVLYIVPPMVLFLGSHPAVKQKHLEPIRFAITGGAPCGQTDIERVMARKKIPILQAYGLTEASPLLTYPDLSCTDTSTVGVPICNTLVKVVDYDTGAERQTGEVGELCFKGPQIMKGYHNKPEETKETIDQEGWLHTGDIGFYDKKGYLYIVDRKKELIKVKGYQVPPAELEAILREHPRVADAGVVGVPSKKSGEKPVGFLVAKPGIGKLETTLVVEYLAARVAPYKRIKHFLVIDSIPKSVSGKILRRELKEMAKDKFPD